MARAGEWPVTYPASCELTFATMFVAAQADEHGWGSRVRSEVEAVDPARVRRRDDWLAEHPPTFEWWPNAVMPMDIPESEPIVATMTARALTSAGPAGSAAWTPGTTARRLTQLAGIPSIGYGPPASIPRR